MTSAFLLIKMLERGCIPMKLYRLANKKFRDTVDLTLYRDIIEKAVRKIKPEATVTVLKEGFYLDIEPTKTESIRISQELRSDELEQYTTYRPCLFNGYYVENNKLHISQKEDKDDAK